MRWSYETLTVGTPRASGRWVVVSDKSSTENVTWWDKSRVLPFMDDSPPPVVGTRLRLAGHAGTVRFVGNVDNTSGIWLGVEWDDPKRGKHDGLKDGKRYFTCR